MQETFDNLEFPTQPKNTLKITLTNEETGKIDYETELENTVGLIFTQKANMNYKSFASYNNYGFGNPVPGSGITGLWLYDYNPGVTVDNAYTNFTLYSAAGLQYDATNTTKNSTFHVYDVYPSYSIYSNVLYITTFYNDNTVMQIGDSITQGANTTTITGIIDANRIQVASISGWIGQNDAGQTGAALTAYNYQNAITTAGTQGGIYLPQLSGFQQNRAYTWSYEWGTTQGNGVISCVSFNDNASVPELQYGGAAIQVAKVSQMSTLPYWTYAGYKTSGAQKQLHFVNRQTNTNNVVIVNHDDFSLVSQATITNPALGLGYASHDIIYTPANGGWYYVFTTFSGHNFSFRKVVESPSMTFPGTNTVTANMSVPGWENSGYWNIANITSDETYIYMLIYSWQNYQSAILTFDPSTDTIVSIVKNPAGFGGVGGIGDNSGLFNICPVTGKLMTRSGNAYIIEWTSITQPTTQLYISWWQNNQLGSFYPTFLMHQTTSPTDRLVGCDAENSSASNYGNFWELTRGNFYTYAELPVPITKTNTQSLRVSYTLNFA